MSTQLWRGVGRAWALLLWASGPLLALGAAGEAWVPVAPPAPFLGEAPRLPAVPPTPSKPVGPTAKSVTTPSLSVDLTTREASRNFYLAIYNASEGVPSGWTGFITGTPGNVTGGAPGTTTTAFQTATLLRLNWFRAMAGIPANVGFDPVFSAKDQQAALMFSANVALSHFPPSTWFLYTADGREAAENSNIAFGNRGPDAITAFMEDFGANNNIVGHRRWFLYPQTQTMGTGDVDASGSFSAANAVWVFDGRFGTTRPTVRDEFVAWPPPGFVPYQVIYPRWSFGYPGADFTNTTVTMTRGGQALAVRLETISGGVGENSLVWVPDGQDANAPYVPMVPPSDTVWTVQLNNVSIGGTPRNFSYTVTEFDPAQSGPDTIVPTVSGSTAPAALSPSTYTFQSPVGADDFDWQSSTLETPTWIDGAEAGLDRWTLVAPVGFNAIKSNIRHTGSNAFFLANPQFADTSLVLQRSVLVNASTSVRFQSRIPFATSGQLALVQVSLDDGLSWLDAYSQVGTSTGSQMEGSFSQRTVSLATWAGRVVKVRFTFEHVGGSAFVADLNSPTDTRGWFVDQIQLLNAEEVAESVITSGTPGATSFAFTAPAAGKYILSVRGKLFGQFPLAWGPTLQVQATGPVASAIANWRATHFPGVSETGDAANTADPNRNGYANLMDFAFGLNPTLPGLQGRRPVVTTGLEGGQTYVLLTFYRRREANAGITYTLQQATSPASTWTDLNLAVQQVGAAVDQGDNTERVTVRSTMPVSTTPVFLRLAISPVAP